jgi:hypothetical protein
MATYRYGVVRSRIAASQLVAGAGQRFESARRLSSIGLDKLNTRNKSVAGQRVGASLHHPYITDARTRGGVYGSLVRTPLLEGLRSCGSLHLTGKSWPQSRPDSG